MYLLATNSRKIRVGGCERRGEVWAKMKERKQETQKRKLDKQDGS
jgi:hypothetical protein